MTAPDELQRAVERLSEMTDWTARGNPGSEVSVMMASNVLRLLLSERAELLATVERMRGGLEKIASGLPETRAVHRLSEARAIARAALTTGEEK